MKLKGRIAVVTGAGSGIGRAVAHGFSEEGSRVVVVDIDGASGGVAVEIRGRGGDVYACETDVADPKSVGELRSFVRSNCGTLDILVNNAAIQVSKLIEDTTPEEWTRQMAVNVGGVFIFPGHFCEICERRRGVMINMSSVNGFFAEPECAGYCATKGAILAFTKAIAIDHGKEGIRVHAICPGYIDAGLAAGYFEAQKDPLKRRGPRPVLSMLWAELGSRQKSLAPRSF